MLLNKCCIRIHDLPQSHDRYSSQSSAKFKMSWRSGIASISHQFNQMSVTPDRQGTGQSPSEESLPLTSSGELPKKQRWSIEVAVVNVNIVFDVAVCN